MAVWELFTLRRAVRRTLARLTRHAGTSGGRSPAGPTGGPDLWELFFSLGYGILRYYEIYWRACEAEYMTDEDWGAYEAGFVEKLRAEKTEPVPEPIIRLAQQSRNGQQHPDNPELVKHAMHVELDTEAKAQAFAKHMRNAGAHTTPPSSITVIVDPDRKKVQATTDEGGLRWTDDGKPLMVAGPPVNPRKVAFRAGPRRGKTA